MQLDEDQQRWFDRVRVEWQTVMRPGASMMGRHLLGPPLWLPDAAAEGARLFSSRITALKHFAQGGTVAEVGTQTGGFARLILDTCRPDALHLFDLEFETLRARNPDVASDPRVALHLGDSSALLAALPDASFDWLYIDGDHSLAGVERDIAQATRKVKPGGTLVFNDYVLWSILECVDYGVVPAVNALLCSGEWRIVYLALHPLMYCDLAITRV